MLCLICFSFTLLGRGQNASQFKGTWLISIFQQGPLTQTVMIPITEHSCKILHVHVCEHLLQFIHGRGQRKGESFLVLTEVFTFTEKKLWSVRLSWECNGQIILRSRNMSHSVCSNLPKEQKIAWHGEIRTEVFLFFNYLFPRHNIVLAEAMYYQGRESGFLCYLES